MMSQALLRLSELIDLGGPVVALLIGFSVLALACVLWKALVFYANGIGAQVSRGFGRDIVVQSQMAKRSGRADADIRARANARMERDFERVGRGLRLLDIIAQVAPLLGLFGTVLGMITAFQTLQSAGGTADPAVLAGGIWVALVTTAAGLIVAMPTSMALSWFDGCLERHERALRDALEEVLVPNLFDAPATPDRPLEPVHAG